MKRIFIFIALPLLVFSSCKKDTPAQADGGTGSVTLEFDNVVGGDNLQLNTGTYTTATGELYTISLFDYYISNIALLKSDGSEYTVPKDSSYFLIKESDPSQSITLNNIPAGDYTGLRFVVGVDSLKSTAPVSARTGVLDPAGAAADMYWTWNSGYIFFKMEGTSPASTTADKKIYYHIGGFGGYESATINNLKTITLQAPSGMSAKVRKDKEEAPEVHLFVDAAKVLSGSTNVSIAANSTIMFSPASQTIADNYTGMFSINHIHND